MLTRSASVTRAKARRAAWSRRGRAGCDATAGDHGCELPPAIAGRQDHGVARVDGRLEPVERADVLAAEVDVDERRDVAVREDLPRQRRVPLDEVVEHLAHRRSVDLDVPRAADLVPERGRDADDGHDACTPGTPEQNST